MRHALGCFLFGTALLLALGTSARAQGGNPFLKSPEPTEVVTRFGSALESALVQSQSAAGPSQRELDLAVRQLIQKTVSGSLNVATPGAGSVRTQNTNQESLPRTASLRKIGDKWLGTYRLEFKGVPLSESSHVSSSTMADGSGTVLRQRNTPSGFKFDTDKDLLQQVDISPEKAMDAAVEELRRLAEGTARASSATGLRLRRSNLEIWVDPSSRQGHLAWALELAKGRDVKEGGEPPAFRAWVAAQASGDRPEVFEVRELVIQEHSGRLTGAVWDPTPLDAVKIDVIGAAQVTRAFSPNGTNPTDATTGPDGKFKFATGNGTAEFSVTLDNTHFHVANGAGDLMKIKATGDTSTPIELVGASDQEFRIAQTSAFVWANRARAFVAEALQENELAEIELLVNAEGECNAFFNSASFRITLFRASSAGSSEKCINRAYKDTVFHEFGHAVDHALGGIASTADGRSYSEGFGDAMAILLKNESCYGKNSHGPGKCLRDAANPKIMHPSTNLEIHERGRIYSGFVWELIAALEKGSNRDQALATAKRLVLQSAVLNPTGIANAIALMFEADDDDGDLTNGTPNSVAIAAAAKARNIPLPSELPPQ